MDGILKDGIKWVLSDQIAVIIFNVWRFSFLPSSPHFFTNYTAASHLFENVTTFITGLFPTCHLKFTVIFLSVSLIFLSRMNWLNFTFFVFLVLFRFSPVTFFRITLLSTY